MPQRVLTAFLLWLLVSARAAGGQTAAVPDDAWDGRRALDLVERARERRQAPQRDTALRNYRARAEGFVYFYLDRRETGERTLVKTDQVALELFWAPPDRTRQRIVGLRDESRLPNRMRYHLDHLTVVQDGFGDVIRMGDGDEVADVPHPAAPGSDSIYSFRLADSLTLRLPGQGAEIRVYEIQVRPRRTDRSALVGSMYIERGTADIVRMTFTFTPVSYVDRRLDYISVSLDNGLWDGRYWLPNEQTLQIRRQIPELDFAAGAVIQGRMRVTDYVFNDTLPPNTFVGYPVTAVPEEERRAFAFQSDLYADLNELGLAAPADLATIRQQAAALLGTRRLSGLPSWRLNLESASAALRYNRAEGLTPGLGITYAPGPPLRADASFGYAFAAGRPWLLATARLDRDRGDAALRLHVRDLRDLGVTPGVPGAINSLTSMFAGDDYLDPWYATGARITVRERIAPRLVASVEVAAERHGNATLSHAHALFNDGAAFRPVRRIDEGDVVILTGAVRRLAPDPRASTWGGSLAFEAGTLDGTVWVRPVADGLLRLASTDQRRALTLTGGAGYTNVDAPAQRLFLLGGPGSLPGYDYRAFAGRWVGLLSAEATSTVLRPWLGLRAVAAAGFTGGLATTSLAPQPLRSAWHTWQVSGTDGIRASAGAGVSLLWDLLRIDVVHPLERGRWRLDVSFHRDFWDIS